MRITVRIVLISVIFIGLAYCIYVYSEYKYYKGNEYTTLRNELARFITQLYVKDDYTIPYSIEYIYSEADKINGLSYPYYVEMLKLLEKEMVHLRIKYVSDSNTLIIYSTGFDKIDEKLSNKILNLDSLSYFDYLFQRKGDVIISWVQFLNDKNS